MTERFSEKQVSLHHFWRSHPARHFGSRVTQKKIDSSVTRPAKIELFIDENHSSIAHIYHTALVRSWY